jgi:hypothetical protein
MLERYVYLRLTPEVLEERTKRSREVRSLAASPDTGPVLSTAVQPPTVVQPQTAAHACL